MVLAVVGAKAGWWLGSAVIRWVGVDSGMPVERPVLLIQLSLVRLLPALRPQVYHSSLWTNPCSLPYPTSKSLLSPDVRHQLKDKKHTWTCP